MDPQETESHCLEMVATMPYHGLAFIGPCLSFHFFQNKTRMVELDAIVT